VEQNWDVHILNKGKGSANTTPQARTEQVTLNNISAKVASTLTEQVLGFLPFLKIEV
jgi:hypothetical protein